MDTPVQDFDTDQEAKDACTALNQAIPYEYSIVESLIRQTREHTETRDVGQENDERYTRALNQLADQYCELADQYTGILQSKSESNLPLDHDVYTYVQSRITDWKHGANLILQSFPHTKRYLRHHRVQLNQAA